MIYTQLIPYLAVYLLHDSITDNQKKLRLHAPLWHITVLFFGVSCLMSLPTWMCYCLCTLLHRDCPRVATCRWEVYSREIGIFKDYLHCACNNTPHSLLLHVLESALQVKRSEQLRGLWTTCWNNFTLMNFKLKNHKGPYRPHTFTDEEIKTIRKAPSGGLYNQTLREKYSCISSVCMQSEKNFFCYFLKEWDSLKHFSAPNT